jgi:hypothetical protein
MSSTNNGYIKVMFRANSGEITEYFKSRKSTALNSGIKKPLTGFPGSPCNDLL